MNSDSAELHSVPTKKPHKIKFAGFCIVTLPHRQLEITSFSSRTVLKYKCFGFPLCLQLGWRRPKRV